MINQIYQLIKPKFFEVKFSDISLTNDFIIVRPEYLALCNADQRYYLGNRDPIKLNKKLPMALIHECCGKVVYDSTNTFNVGDRVSLIPNQNDEKKLNGFYENYDLNSYFMSSGHDGFMQEYVQMRRDRVISCNNINPIIASIIEFISVCMHSFDRFNKLSHEVREDILIVGDGSLAYVMANVLAYKLPKSKISILGRHYDKLNMFSFAENIFFSNEEISNNSFDHAFECCGGIGSEYAINDIINFIRPQGSIMLMGVSENKVLINTRDILEKGITLIGSSRSGYNDFYNTIKMLENRRFENQLEKIVTFYGKVKNIQDIHKVFREDITNPFKTVFKWDV